MNQREIKFRVWNTNSEQFVPADETRIYPNGLIEGDDGREWVTTTPDVNIFQQFTGLKDKNGKEIYEGDIVILGFDTQKKFPRQIIWEGFGFWCKQINGEGNYPLTMVNITKDANLPIDETDWVVIGNIYENPELLK